MARARRRGIRKAGEEGGGVACSWGGGLNAEKVSTEISFATGVQSPRLVILVFVLMEWNSSVLFRSGRIFLLTAARQ